MLRIIYKEKNLVSHSTPLSPIYISIPDFILTTTTTKKNFSNCSVNNNNGNNNSSICVFINRYSSKSLQRKNSKSRTFPTTLLEES